MTPNPDRIPPPPPPPEKRSNEGAFDENAWRASAAKTNAAIRGEANEQQAAEATRALLDAGIEAKDSAVKLVSAVHSAIGLAERVVKQQMQERPYVTMSAAAGAGFVVAGGLASSITRGLIKAGTKAATAYVIGMVLDKAKDAAKAAAEAASASPSPEPSPAE